MKGLKLLIHICMYAQFVDLSTIFALILAMLMPICVPKKKSNSN